ncbi:MAG: ring-cleaving dioxygenase [Opitutaceae bacterium]|nr:ring-cleaving dioxygenase [Opitutaceae bacterium]
MTTTSSPITGIHHLTAIASDPQANVDFYAGLLGLRLVKKTVNFDDPSAYHLYYGDETGSPGTIVTFFTWPGVGGRGRVGSGQVARITLSTAPESLDFWTERLRRHGVAVARAMRFGEDVLEFADPDGIPVEIVAVANDQRVGWSGGAVPAAFALRGLHTAELAIATPQITETLITGDMGYRLVRREGDRARFETGAGGSGTFIDVVATPHAPRGLGGVGTIHHIAWRVPDDTGELTLQARLAAGGTLVSPVRDRSYFRSIYYRERGGVLFEIATDVPGFAHDEPAVSLGGALKLPAQYEPARAEIEKHLPPLRPARTYA